MASAKQSGGWIILKLDSTPIPTVRIGRGSSTLLNVVFVDNTVFESGDRYIAVRTGEGLGHIMPGEEIVIGVTTYRILNPYDVRNYTKSLAPEDWGLGI